ADTGRGILFLPLGQLCRLPRAERYLMAMFDKAAAQRLGNNAGAEYADLHGIVPTRESPRLHFSGEKSVGSANTDSTLLTILPAASDSVRTLFQSGSLRKSSQFFLAASPLSCAIM